MFAEKVFQMLLSVYSRSEQENQPTTDFDISAISPLHYFDPTHSYYLDETRFEPIEYPNTQLVIDEPESTPIEVIPAEHRGVESPQQQKVISLNFISFK
jgi:hypothetical protein